MRLTAKIAWTSTLSFILIAFLYIPVFAFTAEIENDYQAGKISLAQKMTYKALLLTDPDALPSEYRMERPMKDGTLIVKEIIEYWDQADPVFKNRFSFLLSRVPKQACFDTPSGFFRIHYDTLGGHAVYQPAVDVDPPDGVPDYVNRTGEYFDRAWFYQCDTLGYDTPPSDSTMGGGINLYDVYMHHYAGAYGVTFMEFPSYQRPGRNNDYTSYIYVDPTYAGFGYVDRTLPMKVTSAHEFFHAVQFAYSVNAGGWYMENCATWMEDIMWDDINDNYAYLYYFMYYPHYSLTTANGGFEYGAFIWPMFLYENLGHEFIRQSWVYAIDLPALSALDQLCIDYGTFLEEQYVNFSLWNYLTNCRDDGNHYEEGGFYNLARTMRNHTGYPVVNMSSSSRPDPLACNYVCFQNTGQTGDLNLVFDGEDNQIWYLQLVKAYADNHHIYDIVELNFQNYREYTIENFGQYQWVAMVASLLQGSNGDYTYSTHLIQTGIDHNGVQLPGNIALNGSYPNPFNSRTLISVFSPSPVSAEVAVFDIAGRVILSRKVDLIGGDNDIEINPENHGNGNISSGVLYYTITTLNKKLAGKMLYLK